MRHPIEESPRDGTAIILQDDASGTRDVAHWSTEEGQWLSENGDPTRITPTHWYPLARDQYRLQEDEISRNQTRPDRAQRLAIFSVALTLVATVPIVTYFRADVVAYVARYAGHENKPITEQGSRLASQVSRARSLEEESEIAVALMRQAHAVAPAARQELTVSTAQPRQAVEEECARSSALASELAGARREIESQAAQSQKAVDEALQQKQAAEAATAELQHSLQQERDRIEVMARDRANAQRPTARRVAVGSSADSHVVHVTQAVKTFATKPPKAAETQDNAETAKLIARASALLGQGNIGAARIVLERAAESDAKASFMLAETYDPAILSAWGTLGTRGEAAKAREYYAKAHTGGIPEAKDRLDALRQ